MIPVLVWGSHWEAPHELGSISACRTTRTEKFQSSKPMRLCQNLTCRSRRVSRGLVAEQPRTKNRRAQTTRMGILYYTSQSFVTDVENSVFDLERIGGLCCNYSHP